MRHAVLLLTAAGCGRVAFDMTPDASEDRGDVAAVGHDEDGDGIPDLSDVCPHVANANQVDGDGDGVGDDCDPNALVPRDRIRLFATMQPGDQPLVPSGSGTWTQLADALRFDGPVTAVFGNLHMPLVVGDVRVTLGVDITEIAPMSMGQQHQLAIAVADQAPVLFAEINEIMPSFSNAQITLFDGTTYSQVQSMPLPAGVHTGAFTIELTQRIGIGTEARMGWPGEMYSIQEPSTLYQGATQLDVNVNYLFLEFRYLCVIESQ